MKIYVINGPNLNMLGKREPSVYGKITLEEINLNLKKEAVRLGVGIEFFQSNSEGELVSKIQRLPKEGTDGFILNAGAYTHTSIAIRDAILTSDLPFIEVHLSNVFKREDFRKISYLSDIAMGVISGFGYLSYALALEALAAYFKAQAQA